ncbi:MAG: beta-galactosidase, partial [Kiritimatiellae bacterium]|nr:beta-galactosidase [Kiritimatiellia bacterium]
MHLKHCRARLASVVLLTAAACLTASAFDAFITIQDGYFFDPSTGQPWVPHGIAYQTWNRPLGVWQTYEQIEYDLDEMVKMGANSVRIDMVWQHIEGDGAASVAEGDNNFDWEKYDFFVQACEERNLRIFALIGYQWPPNWFPDDWYTMHPPETDSEGIYHNERWLSDIINYEHPAARAQYTEWLGAVAGHFKDSKAIVGWIVGNESGYLGLWSGLLDGYDPWCEGAFQDWCSNKYSTIANCNARWGTSFTAFTNISFVEQYRAYGPEGAEWADMVQWREDSIGSFTAVGAVGAKSADTNHLISYSTVGMQWGEEDWRYHAEDRGKITTACALSNAPIDFFSVNNYPWSILGHESQQGHWGISYTKKVAKVPVLYSETGFTSSESMWPGMDESRQGPLVRNAMWESLEAGAIGTHVFAWHDRPYITDREKGFGILTADRRIKEAFWDCQNMFNLMDQVDIHGLLSDSEDPTPDIAFLFTDAVDSQYNRYECEMQQIAGALERLGFEPWFMNIHDLGRGDYTNYKAVFLPRNMRVEDEVPDSGKTVLDFLRTEVIPAGVHVIAGADLPGMQDANGNARPQFETEVAALFGVDVSDVGGYEIPARRREFVSDYWHPLEVNFTSNAVGAVAGGYSYTPHVWKYNDEVKVTDGVLWATMDSQRNKGFEDNDTWLEKWDGQWGGAGVVHDCAWAYDGENVGLLYGDSGMYKEFPIVPFGRYTASAYLRHNTGLALGSNEEAYVAVEWYDEDDELLGVSEGMHLTAASPRDAWTLSKADAQAPEDAWTGRRVIRLVSTNAPGTDVVLNGGLSGTGPWPTQWTGWNDGSSDPDSGTYHGSSPAWAFWWDGGIYQDVTNGVNPGDVLHFGGYLRHPSWDALRNGTKYGVIDLEFYNGAALISSTSASPRVNSASVQDTWLLSQATATVPAGANRARILVRCNDYSSGDGRFLVDDVFMRNQTSGGKVYVDNRHEAPAVIVKDHGTAKAALFTYTVGDILPDGDADGEMDVQPWQWRYDIFEALLKDSFGIEPIMEITGPDNFLCLAEYRTCADSSTLWQIKNYMYDRFHAGGGPSLTFTITSPLFVGKTVEAYKQGRIIETNCDGTIELTLVPDGMEMLHAFGPPTNKYVARIMDAPSLVRPMGDKSYGILVNYDTLTRSDLTLRVAFMEDGDNGDGVTNEFIEVLSGPASGAGSTNIYMWIPDADQSDPDYISTPDGGRYKFAAWLEDPSSNVVSEVTSRASQLKWGVRPVGVLPTALAKGDTAYLDVEWEDLYEQLAWQNTPLVRNETFPGRVGLFRSSKTEALYPGHFQRVNAVCDWLESLGYNGGNPLDISFDNVVVSNLWSDNFSDGNYNGWTQAAGCANWNVEDGALRLWRVGNDDNIMEAG